jgi:hypothetical protein
MKIPMTHGEIRFSRAPARRGWRGGRYAGCRPDHSRVVGLTAERLGVLSSDGQAKVFGATTAAWYGFGATDHNRAGRPCG